MNIFQTPRAYIGAFGAYLVSLLVMIRAFARRQSQLRGVGVHHPSIINIFLALFCVVFFISLFKRTGNILERMALIVSSLFFLLWALEMLSGYGYKWAGIVGSLTASLVVCGLATMIVGIRTIQVIHARNSSPK